MRIASGQSPLTASESCTLRSLKLKNEGKGNLGDLSDPVQQSRRGGVPKNVMCQVCGAHVQYTHKPKHNSVAEQKALDKFWKFPDDEAERCLTLPPYLEAYDILRALLSDLPGHSQRYPGTSRLRIGIFDVLLMMLLLCMMWRTSRAGVVILL